MGLLRILKTYFPDLFFIAHQTSQKLLWGPSFWWARRAANGTDPSLDHPFARPIGLTDSSRRGWRIYLPDRVLCSLCLTAAHRRCQQHDGGI